jgi:uncharacterized lipoprotein YmbA
MMRGRATPATLWGLVCLLLAACLHLGPRPDPTRFFTLTSLPQPEQATARDSSNPAQVAVGVGPIQLPGYLDREQFVTRISQNRFAVSENDRWAEPLEENVANVLALNLSALLLSDSVTRYPWPSNQRPRYQVEIDVARFETDTARTAQLVARWTLRDVASKQALDVSESRLNELAKGTTTEESVAALSGVLADFSREIAKALRSLAHRQ